MSEWRKDGEWIRGMEVEGCVERGCVRRGSGPGFEGGGEVAV